MEGDREIRQIFRILRLSNTGQQKPETRGSEVFWKMGVPHTQARTYYYFYKINLFLRAQCFRSAVNERSTPYTISKKQNQKILVLIDCFRAFKFNRGFQPCVERVTAVTNQCWLSFPFKLVPRSSSLFLSADRKHRGLWGRDFSKIVLTERRCLK